MDKEGSRYIPMQARSTTNYMLMEGSWSAPAAVVERQIRWVGQDSIKSQKGLNLNSFQHVYHPKSLRCLSAREPQLHASFHH